MTTRHLAVVTVLGLAAPCAARASPDVPEPAPVAAPALRPPKLEVDRRRAALVAGTALALWGVAAVQGATRDELEDCRWCDAGDLDRWAREELRWSDVGEAGTLSDVGFFAVTAGAAAAVGWQAYRAAGRREALEDVLLVVASVLVADGLTQVVQQGVGRLRPYASDSPGPYTGRELRSFFSGHASRTFAAAAAATQISRLRGRRGTAWVAAFTFAGAAATAWLRVAADQHWATDVLAGAGMGSLVGWGVPTFALRPSGRGAQVLPAPGGIAVVF
jgi:membrane-associated phospholipid phosphatase